MGKLIGEIVNRFSAGRGRWLAWLGVVMAPMLVVISCSTVSRSVVQLPNVPGATYIGSDQCDTCHDNIYKDFVTADHARLMARGTNANSATPIPTAPGSNGRLE